MTANAQTIEFAIADLQQTARLAAAFAPFLRAKDCVALTGDLGAGKTCFTRYLVETLGFVDEVQSPTFTILREYFQRDLAAIKSGTLNATHNDIEAQFQAALIKAQEAAWQIWQSQAITTIYHFDAYRLETVANFQASALDDYFGQGLCLIEWGDLLAPILPKETIYFNFAHAQSTSNLSDFDFNDLANFAVDLVSKRQVTLTIPNRLINERKAAWQALVALKAVFQKEIDSEKE